MTIKKEIEAAAIEHIKCPSCGAEPNQRCRNRNADDQGRHKFVPTHQRRKSAFMSSEHCRYEYTEHHY